MLAARWPDGDVPTQAWDSTAAPLGAGDGCTSGRLRNEHLLAILDADLDLIGIRNREPVAALAGAGALAAGRLFAGVDVERAHCTRDWSHQRGGVQIVLRLSNVDLGHGDLRARRVHVGGGVG